jgi:hypothetical protein
MDTPIHYLGSVTIKAHTALNIPIAGDRKRAKSTVTVLRELLEQMLQLVYNGVHLQAMQHSGVVRDHKLHVVILKDALDNKGVGKIPLHKLFFGSDIRIIYDE